ncbi:MAG TPA: gamma-glutamyl-gamma-aminobutyrate hydrolase [Aminobacterium sp.]|uniref:gamma-glutamyl-gamma-aminobutyrate hydrolase family protein n=2 Tax=Aminobacteriaceae TaxID=3029087 RepID=UPI000EBFB6D5|nr:gamma-glutamyl-gamma-aminobutyrate hydrolase family protein [Aminobacterium sp. UBA4834]HCA40381.1 gamma-glutamyl-gamma-aminobutyrate hydrolase [Aminobacterium sp.]
MKKPVIGIIGNILFEKSEDMPGLERNYVNRDYTKAIEKAGGVPVILPVVGNLSLAPFLIERVDGVLVSGGYDINPLLYGEEPERKLGFVSASVDRSQLAIIQAALEARKPYLGICKGAQLLNVALEGSLYQDISCKDNFFVKHSQDAPRGEATHSIKIATGSILASLFPHEIAVNSYHHQSIKNCGKGLKVTAQAADGVIEAVEKDGDPFVMGVQWHPEMMLSLSDLMLPLFQHFVEKSSQ